MGKRDAKKYSNFSNVEQQQERLTTQELPEGAYGSPINADEPVQGKSTPWKEGQYQDSNFVYPDREFHDNRPRQYDGAHPLHDEPENSTEEEH